MTRPLAVPEAVDRLRLSGDAEVLGFINEVKGKSNKELLRVLPSVDGFRKDSASSLPMRKRTMLGYLLKKGGGTASNKARADSTYYYFWRAWAEEHLNEVEGLSDALEEIEKVAPNDGSSTAEVEKAVERLFRLLQEQSFLNHCSSEAIYRLLHFSPFAITDQLDRLATSAKPQIAVEKDRAFSTLPKRLSDDEERLKRVEERVSELTEEFSLLMAGQPQQSDEAPVPAVPPQALTDAQARIDDLSERFQALEKAVRHSAEEDTTSQRLDALERGVAYIEALWAETEDRSTRAHDALRQQVIELGERSEGSAAPVVVTAPQAPATFPSLTVLVPRAPVTNVKLLANGTDAASLLAANLQALGVKPSGALVFAQEVLAAVVTGKVLFLNGSFAPDVARVVAETLGGAHTRRVRVPVGYVDAAHIDGDVLDTLPSPREGAAVLVLERVNNAPLEVLADAIIELARAADIFVVGTLSEGVSTLPAHPQYLQLGPVFETDALDWSLFPKVGAGVTTGTLASLEAAALSMAHSKARPATDELLRLLRKVPQASNRRLERSVLAYLTTLEAFRPESTPTSLQSVAFGWLWPLWRMIGLTTAECDEELVGGNVDGDAADPRVAWLLNAAGREDA